MCFVDVKLYRVQDNRNFYLNFFIDKEHILISRWYELHPASATTRALAAPRMHTAQNKKKNYEKKSRYSDLFLVTADLTPPKQYKKSSFSRSDVSKKGTMLKRRRNQLMSDLGFSPWKFRLWTSPVLSPPLAVAAAPSHESLSQFLFATKTRTTIASAQI